MPIIGWPMPIISKLAVEVHWLSADYRPIISAPLDIRDGIQLVRLQWHCCVCQGCGWGRVRWRHKHSKFTLHSQFNLITCISGQELGASTVHTRIEGHVWWKTYKVSLLRTSVFPQWYELSAFWYLPSNCVFMYRLIVDTQKLCFVVYFVLFHFVVLLFLYFFCSFFICMFFLLCTVCTISLLNISIYCSA